MINYNNLQKSAQLAHKALLQAISTKDKTTHVFSAEFEKKMEAVFASPCKNPKLSDDTTTFN